MSCNAGSKTSTLCCDQATQRLKNQSSQLPIQNKLTLQCMHNYVTVQLFNTSWSITAICVKIYNHNIPTWYANERFLMQWIYYMYVIHDYCLHVNEGVFLYNYILCKIKSNHPLKKYCSSYMYTISVSCPFSCMPIIIAMHNDIIILEDLSIHII